MENQISKYVGRNDLVKSIASLEVVSGTARETGNTYYAISLKFRNGYEHRIFLRGAEAFAWVNAFELLDTEKQVSMSDNAF